MSSYFLVGIALWLLFTVHHCSKIVGTLYGDEMTESHAESTVHIT